MSTNTVETAVGSDNATSFEAGSTGAVTRDNAGVVLDTGEVTEKPPEESTEKTPETPETPEKKGEEETPPETSEDLPVWEPLPEFDAAKPEVKEAYDARFLNPESKQLDREAISRDFWEARAKDPKAYLSPGTMAWTTSHFGVDEAFVKDVCDGLMRNNVDRDNSVFSSLAPEGTPEAERVEAGKQTLSDAAKWARDGGYTAEQAAAFNKLAKKGGPEYQDAMELLIVRHKAAMAKAAPAAQPQERRPASPQRVVSGGGAETVAVTPYKDRAEYRADRKAAGADPAKVALTRQRALISDFG